MPIKVSVIIPVYNPGPYLERCLSSVLVQSLPDTDYEAIFVDDGSTDEAPARLDALAASHPNVVVIHQVNSGWSGKPRNVGIDAARGEYVFFLDQDDALGPDALERLHDFALRNGSDVVIGRMEGHQRGVPRQLFTQSRDRVTPWDSHIVDSLTPHKLFRRAFLDEHGLRFPEGRRRLEDHVFVLRSYFAASVISVLAEPVCYHHYQRPDRRNASYELTDPAYYYHFLREVLGVVEAHTEPGPRRDIILLRFARRELLDRLAGRRFLAFPAGHRAALFAEIRAVIDAHLPPTVDALLPPFQRTQMALVRAGRLDLLVQAAKWQQGVAGVARRWTAERPPTGPLTLAIEASLAAGRGAPLLGRSGDRYLLGVPPAVAAVVPDAARAVEVPIGGSTFVLLRRRGDGAEVTVPSHRDRRIEEAQGRCAIVDRVTATLDPASFASGSRARPATWDLIARIGCLGLNAEVRVAQMEVSGESRVVLQRPPGFGGRLFGQARRRALAALTTGSRHLDPRLRERIWRVAGRFGRRLGG